MQQASVEKFSDLIGSVYDCVIAPEGWTEVLDQICAEFGFAAGALSVASLTNMKAVVKRSPGPTWPRWPRTGSATAPTPSRSGAAPNAFGNPRSASRSFNPKPSGRTLFPAT